MMIMCLLAASVQPGQCDGRFLHAGIEIGHVADAHAVDLRKHDLAIGADANHAALGSGPTAIGRCRSRKSARSNRAGPVP